MAELNNLIVNGKAKFNDGLTGNLKGNADTATKADTVKDSANGNTVNVSPGSTINSAAKLAVWDGNNLKSVNTGNVTVGKATTAVYPAGFTSGGATTWGNQEGTSVAHWYSGSGEVDFRRTATNGGQINMKLDGVYYQREGKQIVIDDSTINNYAPTKTGSGASGTWPISVSGKAATAGTADQANKLSAARTIALSGGATGSASFDGSGNVTIPVTNIDASKVTGTTKAQIYEANLQWGGKNFAGKYGPIDAAMVTQLGANRFAFMPAKAITIEYSRDSGSTWTDYGASDAEKVDLFDGNNSWITIGKADADHKATAAYMLRVSIDVSLSGVYNTFNKFCLYVSTSGSTGSYVTIRGKKQKDIDSKTDVWSTFADKVTIGGWSGYNIINTQDIMLSSGHDGSNSRYGILQFIFGCTGGSDKYNGLQIISIQGYGGVGWSEPSTMASHGRMYTYDWNKNVTFPADIKATHFNGPLNGKATSAASADVAAKATADKNGKDIDATYLKKAGDTAAGTINAPVFNASNYLFATKLRGQGDASSYYHAIDFGASGTDHTDFHEYGGAWNFYQNKSGKSNTGTLVGSIQSGQGWNGLVKGKDINNYPTKAGEGAAGTWGISISGNAATATKATSDGAGNNIQSTYVAQNDVVTDAELNTILNTIKTANR